MGYADVQAAGDQVQNLSTASSPSAIKKACESVFPLSEFPNLQAPIDLSAPKSASDTTGAAPTSEVQQ